VAIGEKLSLRRANQYYSDRLITVMTILLLILLFVVAPFQAAGILYFQAFGVIVALVMIAGVVVISGSLTATVLMAIALTLNVAVIVSRLYHPFGFDLHLVALAWLILAGTLGTVVAKRVFGEGQVGFHRIVGAVFLYLLIAVMFVSLYVVVGALAPGAFSGLVLDDSPKLASAVIYFSFVTLTSVGYGDILPVHPVARSLCNLESVIGQLYPATLLARLVSLELEGRR
jgi:hypothetical protein